MYQSTLAQTVAIQLKSGGVITNTRDLQEIDQSAPNLDKLLTEGSRYAVEVLENNRIKVNGVEYDPKPAKQNNRVFIYTLPNNRLLKLSVVPEGKDFQIHNELAKWSTDSQVGEYFIDLYALGVANNGNIFLIEEETEPYFINSVGGKNVRYIAELENLATNYQRNQDVLRTVWNLQTEEEVVNLLTVVRLAERRVLNDASDFWTDPAQANYGRRKGTNTFRNFDLGMAQNSEWLITYASHVVAAMIDRNIQEQKNPTIKMFQQKI